MKILQKTMLMLLCMLTAGNLLAQRGWEKMSPGVVKDLNDIFFIDSLEGWIVGNSGTIMHTADGGIHWEIQPGSTTDFLQGIWFPDDSNGWIIGNSGTILTTKNKGESWSVADYMLTQDLTDIMFCNPLNGWIVGNNGLIIHTFDGGEQWQYQFAGAGQNLLSVTFTDVNNGWIVRSYTSGWLSHTQNGGTEWVEFPLPVEGLTYCVFFFSPYRGWVGSEGKVLFTDDVGETWSEQFLAGGGGNVTDLFFINDSTGWALTENYIYYTADAGMTWKLQMAAETGDSFSAIYFTDMFHGWIAGKRGLVYATTDGGGTGFGELDLSDRLLLFPNPAAGNVHLRLEDPRYSGTVFTIEITDMAGRLLFRERKPIWNELTVPIEGMKGPVTFRLSREGVSGSRVLILP